MRTKDIAERHEVSRFFIRMIERGDRKTTNIPLAVSIAAKNGKAPASYLNKKTKTWAVKENPALTKKAAL